MRALNQWTLLKISNLGVTDTNHTWYIVIGNVNSNMFVILIYTVLDFICAMEYYRVANVRE